MSPEKQPEDTAGTPEPAEGAELPTPEETPTAGPETDEDTPAEASAVPGDDGSSSDSAATDGPMAPSGAVTEPEPPARPVEVPRQPDLRTVEFSQVSDEGDDGDSGSLEMLMDIRLPVSVELGRTQTLVRDILDYGPGTVVELNKLAGDPVDILVNGKLVAQGEVVVIDDHFGVRVTVLLSPSDRVRSLGG